MVEIVWQLFNLKKKQKIDTKDFFIGFTCLDNYWITTKISEVMKTFVKKDKLDFFYLYYNVNTTTFFSLVKHPDFWILL